MSHVFVIEPGPIARQTWPSVNVQSSSQHLLLCHHLGEAIVSLSVSLAPEVTSCCAISGPALEPSSLLHVTYLPEC